MSEDIHPFDLFLMDAAEAWNLKHPVGTSVLLGNYGRDRPLTVTISPARNIEDVGAVVDVEGDGLERGISTFLLREIEAVERLAEEDKARP